MASFRKTGVNRPQKSSFMNGTPTDTKFKGRSGVIIPNRVFVGNICPTATENDLLNLFGKYGIVKAVKIIFDQNGSSKGYGFVTFDKPDDVTRLQNDAKNLIFNDRRLNIAPAVMKNPPVFGRFPDSYVVPITPNNIYFANNIPYQYPENTSVFPNSHYAPSLTVLPAVSDGTYYQNGYSTSPNFGPSTPYQGAALFYPVPHNTSPVMVGPQSYNSSYPSVSVSNSNYVYSSPAPVTSSPPCSSAKTSTASVASTVSNTSEVHSVHGSSQVVPTSVPPPLPYQLAHPPQYYNGSVAAPPYSGEVYYNMVQGACYPVMTVSGHDAYIPYYDIPDTCSNTVAQEENNYEAQTYHGTTPSVQNYVTELNNKDSSPPTAPSVMNAETKQMMSVVVPQTNPDHVQEQYAAAAEANNAAVAAAAAAAAAQAQVTKQVPVTATPQTPAAVAGHTPHANTDYSNPSNYMQHRNAAIIYPNTPVPQNNIYYNPIYMTEATTPAITQSPYPKNLSEHYVSDHLPKRDSKYSQKKFSTSPQSKDTSVSIPNIPKFPFYVNNNFPGYINRNVEKKEYKNGGNTKINDNKQPPRPPRSNSNGSSGPKLRVFHNQNQFAANTAPPPPRNSHRNGNHVPVQGNVPYPRSSSAGAPRPTHDQTQIRPTYEYQNSYQAQNSYQKMAYEKKNQANGGFHRGKYEKINGGQPPVNNNNNNNNNNHHHHNNNITAAAPIPNETYSKNISPVEEVTKKPIQIESESCVKTNNNDPTANNNNNEECPVPSEQNSTLGLAKVSVSETVQKHQQSQLQQEVCHEMQNLAL